MGFPLKVSVGVIMLAVSACTSFQEVDVPDGLHVDAKEFAFLKSGNSHAVTVSCGAKWDVSSSPEWISLQSISQSNLSSFEWIAVFSAQENDEYNREGIIVIKAGTDAAEISVTQEGKKGKYIAIESVSVSPAELILTEGENASLSCVLTPSNASIQDVTWKSSDISVATVSQTGQVSAVSEGTTTITVTTEDGNKTATCSVTVRPVSVSSVSLDKESLTLKIGESSTLNATVLPENAANKKVLWSSSNTSVATVDSNGKVTGVDVGSAKITVTTDDGGKTATCMVAVNPISVTGVSLNKTSLSLIIGGTEKLTATVTPSNATNKTLTWSSSNSNVATVDSNGNVAAIKVGTAVITVKTDDGGKTATCAVTVNPISVTGVSLNQTSLTMTVGDTQALTATVTPSNATDQSVTWSSNNTSVATVSSSGVVTAKAAGSASITVTAVDGGKKATCTVTVKDQNVSVTGVSLNQTSLTMTEGDTQTLIATVTPSNATDKSVTWSSSNTTVAMVSSSGVVTAKTAGSSTITVTTNDGGKKATCAIAVKAKTVNVTGVSLDKTSLSISVGDTQTLTATVTPSNATDKSLIWSSSNSSIVSLNSQGNVATVMANSAGEATITVKTMDGGYSKGCKVTVIVPVTSITLNRTSVTIPCGRDYQLIADILPTNASDKTLIWSSSNPSIASVSNGNVTTGLTSGTVAISALSKSNPEISATCIVTVEKEEYLSIGGNGNWFINGEDTGLPASNQNGVCYFPNSETGIIEKYVDGVLVEYSPVIKCPNTISSGFDSETGYFYIYGIEGYSGAYRISPLQLYNLSFIKQEGVSEGMLFSGISYVPKALSGMDSANEIQVTKKGDSVKTSNSSVIVKYRTSPKYADLPFLEVGSSKGLSFVVKGGTAPDGFYAIPIFKGYDYEEGVLSVEVNTSGFPNTMIPLTQIALCVERDDGGIVTSDYSTIKREELGNLAIAYPNSYAKKNLLVEDAHYRRASIGISEVDNKAYITDYPVWTTGEQPFEDAEVTCDVFVLYTDAIDLKSIVVAHKVTEEGVDATTMPVELTADDLEAFGLTWEFAVVKNYKLVCNGSEVDQADFVSLNSGVVTPKTSTYGDSAIGKTPIIRVALKHGGDVIDYAYIKVYISDGSW